MKVLFVGLLIIRSLFTTAQNAAYADTYLCKEGTIHFYASTPLEDISPTSHNGICVINTKSKKISAKVDMKTFIFKNGLMQEHFNENYIESDKYPYGILDAEIIDNIDFSKDGVYNVYLKGTFEIHGVKKNQNVKGKLTIKNGQPVYATADFDIKLADYNIKIPTVVVVKIAEIVKVNVEFAFQKYKK